MKGAIRGFTVEGGRLRRYYELTADGTRALQAEAERMRVQAQAVLDRLKDAAAPRRERVRPAFASA